MAVTKIHPIKVNLKAALDYIENPDKTDDKMLVSSFGCSYETADIEFQMLLAQAFNKGNNLAHHLIQAFISILKLHTEPDSKTTQIFTGFAYSFYSSHT